MRELVRKIRRNGLWFPALQWVIDHAHERLSVYAYVNRRFAEATGNSPAFVSEAIQLVFLVAGIVWLLLLRVSPAVPILTWWPLQRFAAFLAVYHIAIDLFVFPLQWTLVPHGPVENLRRSLAGFLLNILELGLYATIALVLMGCPEATLGRQFADIFGPDVTSYKGVVPNVFSAFKTVAGVFLLLVVFGSVVGGITRGEISKNTSDPWDARDGSGRAKTSTPEAEKATTPRA